MPRRIRPIRYFPRPPTPLGALPGCTLTATGASSSSINLSVAYTGPPAAATYTFWQWDPAHGAWVALATQASNAFAVNGLNPSTAYAFMAAVNTNESPSRQTQASTAAASTQSQAGSTQIKFHPGHYAGTDQLIAPYRDPNFTGFIKPEIDLVFTGSAAANTLGYISVVNWAEIENATMGVYDWSKVDQVRDYLVSTYGKRFAVSLAGTQFDHVTPVGCTPQYILNDAATYGAGPGGGAGGGYWTTFSGANSRTAWWRAAVATRYKALFASLAAHQSPGQAAAGIANYDTDPYFEAVTLEESASNVDGGDPTYSAAAFAIAWSDIHNYVVSVFPHTSVMSQNNWGPDSQNRVASMVTTDYNNRCAMSGPDLDANFGTNLAGQSWGYQAYRGTGPGAGPDLLGKMPCLVWVQPNTAGIDYGGDTVAGLANTAINVLGASHIFWGILTGGGTGDWATQVAPVINSTPIPSANKVCPLSYQNAGGCDSSSGIIFQDNYGDRVAAVVSDFSSNGWQNASYSAYDIVNSNLSNVAVINRASAPAPLLANSNVPAGKSRFLQIIFGASEAESRICWHPAQNFVGPEIFISWWEYRLNSNASNEKFLRMGNFQGNGNRGLDIIEGYHGDTQIVELFDQGDPTIYFDFGTLGGVNTNWNAPALHHFELHHLLSTAANSDGLCELFMDGVRIQNITNLRHFFNATAGNNYRYINAIETGGWSSDAGGTFPITRIICEIRYATQRQGVWAMANL
jgi:hypothetical protein